MTTILDIQKQVACKNVDILLDHLRAVQKLKVAPVFSHERLFELLLADGWFEFFRDTRNAYQ